RQINDPTESQSNRRRQQTFTGSQDETGDRSRLANGRRSSTAQQLALMMRVRSGAIDRVNRLQ
ncbi:hypothetical protein, partial [Rhizobium sp. L43]|uniref:hypothetical protein n=1 Tax=Rhizobium sp. L43 TaxID=2035452 RepID=UPI001AEFEB1C